MGEAAVTDPVHPRQGVRCRCAVLLCCWIDQIHQRGPTMCLEVRIGCWCVAYSDPPELTRRHDILKNLRGFQTHMFLVAASSEDDGISYRLIPLRTSVNRTNAPLILMYCLRDASIYTTRSPIPFIFFLTEVRLYEFRPPLNSRCIA